MVRQNKVFKPLCSVYQRLMGVVAVALILLPLGLVQAAEDNASVSFAGNYRIVDPESGEISPPILRISPYQKGEEENLTESQLKKRAWVAEDIETKEKVFFDRMDEKDNEVAAGLKAHGWECTVSSHLLLCGGKAGEKPFDGEDFISQTGWLLIVLHQGPVELIKCGAESCDEPSEQQTPNNDDNIL
ncbi:hypothetical protein I2492_06150 [Budviciaceae bacterium CWB-B4]|uniref:Uncharacterized protein n=1 Tax=Limnobaculum xujianqingii TaxID=2738837 RepID=A0A9D7AH23_9GAMM|nr:hypothetical protein [Limnobaculum xujianqingii]MBK5072591.1 hypothetical protein [Limnobaculum xujianqingii]MBK5175900.1 hypothetical protein [Limnobaculum xujianqingii]